MAISWTFITSEGFSDRTVGRVNEYLEIKKPPLSTGGKIDIDGSDFSVTYVVKIAFYQL